MARVRRPPAAAMHTAAGSAAAARYSSGPLRRAPSPPIGAYQRLSTVPIGNDGIAFPQLVNGSGLALAWAGPAGIGTRWQAAQAAIYTSVGPADPAQAAVYVGPLPTGALSALPQFQVASFLSGGGAQVPLGGVELEPGLYVYAIWTGGTPGALAYLNVTGVKTALTI